MTGYNFQGIALSAVPSVGDSPVWDGTKWMPVAIGSAPVTSVFGRTGAVVAVTGDYDSDEVNNASSVVGATVSDALDTLLAAIPAVPVTSVFGRTGAVVAVAGDYNSDEVTNASGIVPGATVTDALDALAAAIPAVPVISVFGRTGAVIAVAGDYDSDEVDNVSSVGGSTVSDALDTLLAAIPTTPSWASVLAVSATSGANSPQIASGQSLQFLGATATSTVGNLRSFHNWSHTGRNSANTADANLFRWGATTNVINIGENTNVASIDINSAGNTTLSRAGTAKVTVANASVTLESTITSLAIASNAAFTFSRSGTSGGATTIQAQNGGTSGGTLTLTAGNGTTVTGGSVTANAGTGTTGTGGAINLNGGATSGVGTAGAVNINGGSSSSTGTGGAVVITAGNTTGGTPGAISLRIAGGTNAIVINGTGGSWTGTPISIGTAGLAFWNGTAAIKPNVTGSRGGNAALADLLTVLATMGLITDGTSA